MLLRQVQGCLDTAFFRSLHLSGKHDRQLAVQQSLAHMGATALHDLLVLLHTGLLATHDILVQSRPRWVAMVVPPSSDPGCWLCSKAGAHGPGLGRPARPAGAAGWRALHQAGCTGAAHAGGADAGQPSAGGLPVSLRPLKSAVPRSTCLTCMWDRCTAGQMCTGAVKAQRAGADRAPCLHPCQHDGALNGWAATCCRPLMSPHSTDTGSQRTGSVACVLLGGMVTWHPLKVPMSLLGGPRALTMNSPLPRLQQSEDLPCASRAADFWVQHLEECRAPEDDAAIPALRGSLAAPAVQGTALAGVPGMRSEGCVG